MRMQALKSHYKGAKQFKLTATLIKPIKNIMFIYLLVIQMFMFLYTVKYWNHPFSYCFFISDCKN